MTLTGDDDGAVGTDRRQLLQVRTIYAEPTALALPRGQQVVSRWPGAEVLALGVCKTLPARRNERSANWIAPSTGNGCAMACGYC